MIHQFKNNGYNIVLDVHSGAVHVVDDLVYDLLELVGENFEAECPASVLTALSAYPANDVIEAYNELRSLKEEGILFSEDDYEKFAEGDALEIKGFAEAVAGATEATLVNKTNGAEAKLSLNLTARQREMLLAGGCLNYTKNQK